MKSIWVMVGLPLVAVPALLATGAALLVLVAGVAGAAAGSRPGDLLFGVRKPALMLQLALTDDASRRAEIEASLGQSSAPLDKSAVAPLSLTAEPIAEELEFTGTISEIGDGFIVVAGETVFTGSAEIKGDLAVGAIVKVHASRDANGALVASEVETETGLGDGNANDNANEIDDNANEIDNGNANEIDNGNAN